MMESITCSISSVPALGPTCYHHARKHRAAKRGGNKVELDEAAAVVAQRGVDLIALDEAPDEKRHELAKLNPRQSG